MLLIPWADWKIMLATRRIIGCGTGRCDSYIGAKVQVGKEPKQLVRILVL